MLNLLLAPIKAYHSLFTALSLPHFIPLFSLQTYPTRRSVAGEVARSIFRGRIIIARSDHLEGVLSLLQVLIREGLLQASGYPGLMGRQRSGETDETLEEQGWLARLIHFVQAPDNDSQYQVGYPDAISGIRLTRLAASTNSQSLRSWKRAHQTHHPCVDYSSIEAGPQI